MKHTVLVNETDCGKDDPAGRCLSQEMSTLQLPFVPEAVVLVNEPMQLATYLNRVETIRGGMGEDGEVVGWRYATPDGTPVSKAVTFILLND